jgi:hypothetical protein
VNAASRLKLDVIAVLTCVRCLVQRGLDLQLQTDSWPGTITDDAAPDKLVFGKRAGGLCSRARRIVRLEAHRAEEDQGRYLTHIEFISQTWRGHVWSHHWLHCIPRRG